MNLQETLGLLKEMRTLLSFEFDKSEEDHKFMRLLDEKIERVGHELFKKHSNLQSAVDDREYREEGL